MSDSTVSEARPGAKPWTRSELLFPAAVFGVAFALRLLHVLFLQHASPYFTHPVVDAYTYHEQAIAIASGEGHPDKVFWQPPGYAYFLGFLYRLAPSFLVSRLVQALLGALTAALVTDLGRRLFGPRVGLAAGLLTAGYGLLIYFDGELLAPTLGVFLLVVGVSMAVRARAEDSRGHWAFSGFVLGLATAVIAPFLLVAGAVAVHARRRAPLVLLGLAVALAPLTLRNRLVGGEWVLVSYNGGVNLFIGNNPDYDRTVAARPVFGWEELVGAPAQQGVTGYAAQSSFFTRRVFQYLASDPLGFTALQLKKLRLLAGGNELPRNQEIYAQRPYSPVLRLLVWKVGGLAFPWGLLFPLGVLGVAVAWRRAPLLAAITGLLFVSVWAFFITARYRVPMVPFLALFAVEGIRWLARAAAVRARAVAVAGLVPLYLACNLGQGPMNPEMNPDAELSLAFQLREEDHDPAAAIPFFRSALKKVPGYSAGWAALASSLAETGQLTEAIPLLRKVVELRPKDPGPLNDLGSALARTGRLDEAIDCYQRVLALRPDDAMARENLEHARKLKARAARQAP